MKGTKWIAGGLLAALLVTAACAIEIFEPDYHYWDTYYAHSDRGRNQCASCHPTVVRGRIGDNGCWKCH